MKLNWRTALLVLAVLLVLGGGAYVAARKLGVTEAGRLDQLLPKVRAAFERGRAELSSVHKIELVVVSTRRSADEQAAKVEAGLSATRQSWHLLGRGIDVQTGRADEDGDLQWDPEGRDLDSYRKLQQVMGKYGFRGTPNGAAFNADGSVRKFANASGKQISDIGHLEWTEGMTFAQAQAKDAKEASA
jgi:hypothetical protein